MDDIATQTLRKLGLSEEEFRLVYDSLPLNKRDSLDAAWAEAEAALLEGWRGPSIAQNWLGRWYAYVYQHHENAPADPSITADVSAEDHDSPIAALRALAAKLREQAG